MRVLFTNAPGSGAAVEPADAWPPLSLVHLAGATRADGHLCQIVDALPFGMGIDEVEQAVRDFQPDVVCVTAATPGIPTSLELCRRVGSAGCTSVIGGIHASFMFPEFLPAGDVDFAVIGEGEETLPELLRCLSAGDDPARVAGIAFAHGNHVVRTAARPRLATLDPLPKAWDLLPASRYSWSDRPGSRMGAVVVSRGCPRHCSCCGPFARYEGNWRMRSVDAVAYELTQLRQEQGMDVVAFYDPAPAADSRSFAGLTLRLAELDLGLELVMWGSVADILRDEDLLPQWRAAGVVHVGICRDPADDRLEEAVRDRALDDGRRAVQALRRAGIASEASFWLGFPDETPATVGDALARALAWDPDRAHFPLLTPLPYTPAWRTYGAHVITRDYARYNHREAVVKPREMEPGEVVEASERCRRRFLAARPTRAPSVEGRRAGPWLVHPVESQAPEQGDPAEQVAPPEPGPPLSPVPRQ